MIKIKKLIKALCLFSIVLILGGCYDYHELNSLDIISGIGITFNDNIYEVTYEVINTSIDKDNKESKKSFIVLGSGKNISEAFYNANNKLNKKPYFQHIKVMIIDDKVDITSISDYLIRSNMITTNFYLVMADNPKEMLGFTSDDKVINANYVYDILKKMNYAKMSNYFDFQVNKIIDKIDISIPKFIIDNKIMFKTYGLYHGNKFTCYLDDFNLNMYNFFLKDNNISYSNDKNSIKLYNNSLKISTKEKISFNFNLKAKVEVLSDDYNLRNNDDFKKLETEFTDSLEKDLTKFIEFLREKQIDLLGINYQYYLKSKKFNDNYFRDTDFEIKVKVKVNKPGLTIRRCQ